jgi:glycerol-3-phosphate acyltransferase PlsY
MDSRFVSAYAACGLLAYLLGAIPFGYLIARARGVDIRRMGSGNIGATNVWRTLGKGPGMATFACDALKGFLPAFVFPELAARWAGTDRATLGIACACLAVAGHNWPVYLGFRGGKGVATTVGALLGVAPAAVGVMLAAWTAVFLASSYVSLASLVAAGVLAASGWFFYFERGLLLPVALSLLAAMAAWRHRANFRRLIQGTENRVPLWRKRQRP